MNCRIRCAILIGPTASGKTGVIRSLARRIPLEVITADSMQIYRRMEILAQTPSEEDRGSIPHHLTGILSPSREFNAARFVRKARRLISAINRRGRLPLVSGGTGFYVTALLDGLFEGPAEQPAIRKRLYRQAAKSGPEALHRRLCRQDPEAARGIHPNDLRRIVRALEVIRVTGRKFSVLRKTREGIWGHWDVRMWGLRWEREELYARIDRRTDGMIRRGLAEEARRLLKKGRLSKTAAGCLGLKESGPFLEGRLSTRSFRQLLQMNTRRFAKRQMAWFRRDPRIEWISMGRGFTASKAARRLAREIRQWKKPSLSR